MGGAFCIPHSVGGMSWRRVLLFGCVRKSQVRGPETGELCWQQLSVYLEGGCSSSAALVCGTGSADSCEPEPPRKGASRVAWQCDTEDLFGLRGEAKLIVSLCLWSSAELMWKPQSCLSGEMGSCWLDHGDVLVTDGECQDEFVHRTSPRFVGGTDEPYPLGG